MTLNIEDIVDFASKVLYTIIKHEISIDKAFQRVKQKWTDRESYKVYYDVVFNVVKNYFKLEYISREIFKTTSCKHIVKTWLALEGANYFRNKSQVLSYVKKFLKKAKFRSVDEFIEHAHRLIENLRERDYVQYLCVKYSFPRAYVEKLLHVMNVEDVERMLDALNKYPTWIRVNTLKIDVDKCVKLLEQQGLEVEPDRKIPFMLKVVSAKRPVHHVEAIREGLAVIQDKASVLAVLALDPKPDDVVLDLCAAPGMKTSLIMQLTENRARVIAVDISASRLESLRYLLKLLGVDLNRVDIVLADSRKLKVRSSLRVDKVLIDAPCTSSGAAGKDPAVRIVLREPKRIPWYCDIQYGLVKNAIEMFREADIVYATCSVFPEEGEEIVKRVLEEHPDVKLARPSIDIRSGYSAYGDIGSNTCRTYPHIDECEGFFIAHLKT